MQRYQIRAAEVDDIGPIGSIALDAWKYTYGSIYPDDVTTQFVASAYSVDSLTGSIDWDSKRAHRLFHVAMDATENMIGFSHVIPDPSGETSFELVRIYALPQSHGTCVGTALLGHLLKTVPGIGELSAWVERDNIIGRKFYKRHGFEVVGEKEDDFFGHKAQLLNYALYPERA